MNSPLPRMPAYVLELGQDWGLSAHRLGPCGPINADSGLGDWREGMGLLAALHAAGHNTELDS